MINTVGKYTTQAYCKHRYLSCHTDSFSETWDTSVPIAGHKVTNSATTTTIHQLVKILQ